MRPRGVRALSQGLLLLWMFTVLAPVWAAGNVLRDISFAALPGNRVQITLKADQPMAEPKTFTTDNPARIAMDFFDMSSGLMRKTVPVGVGMARSVTVVEAGGRTRVVVNLVAQAASDIKVRGNEVIVTIAGSTERIKPASKSRPVAARAVAAPRATVGKTFKHSLKGIDFRRGDAGEGRVVLTLSDPAATVDIREEGGRVVLDIPKTALPDRFARRFDVGDFATPVRMFEVASRGNNVHISIVTSGESEHLAYQANNLYTVEFRPLTREQKEERLRKSKTFTGERLSLNFQDIQVRAILQLLADFTGLNLVTSDTVRGRITLRLQNVPWDQALDIILKTRGLSMRKTGNVVMVAPTEEIAARERLELESQKQIEDLAPLHSEYIQVNYAKATDLQSLLKSEGNELLTPGRGNVTVDPRTNTLLVRDTAAKLEDIRRLVQRLDVPVRQVLVEARVVIANDRFVKDIGVRFGFTRSKSFGDNEVLVGGGNNGFLDGTGGLNSGDFMDRPNNDVNSDGGAENLLVNLPAAAATSSFNMLIGKVGSYLLQLQLSAMQQEGQGELISSPRVITSDKSKAVIKQGVEIPYQEATSSGATSVSFKEAVLKLEVTPSITPDDRVIMDLVVNKDRPDFARSVQGTPPVDTRSVETTVLVDNGETVVLGGVFEQDRTRSNETVPFFGDLPYVGFLFNQELKKDEKQELLIFVTPKILKEALTVR
jgi:type IV pilus assembly protein PilQ